MTYNFKIQGMHCASCAMNIEMEVEEIPGVEKVGVDFVSAQLQVEAAPSVTEKEIISAVEKAGYKAEVLHKQSAQGEVAG